MQSNVVEFPVVERERERDEFMDEATWRAQVWHRDHVSWHDVCLWRPPGSAWQWFVVVRDHVDMKVESGRVFSNRLAAMWDAWSAWWPGEGQRRRRPRRQFFDEDQWETTLWLQRREDFVIVGNDLGKGWDWGLRRIGRCGRTGNEVPIGKRRGTPIVDSPQRYTTQIEAMQAAWLARWPSEGRAA